MHGLLVSRKAHKSVQSIDMVAAVASPAAIMHKTRHKRRRLPLSTIMARSAGLTEDSAMLLCGRCVDTTALSSPAQHSKKAPPIVSPDTTARSTAPPPQLFCLPVVTANDARPPSPHRPDYAADGKNTDRRSSSSMPAREAPHIEMTALSSSSSPIMMVRSTLYVPGICCASEVPVVRRILLSSTAPHHPQSNNTHTVQINVATKRVYVTHDEHVVTAMSLAQRLERCGFACHILEQGGGAHHTVAATMAATITNDSDHNFWTMPVSSYVESSLHVDHMRTHYQVEQVRLLLLPHPHIRAVHAHLASQHIQVEHDVSLSLDAIAELLSNWHATVVHDGTVDRLFLPPTTASSAGRNMADLQIDERLHWNVALAGLFWITSMLSIVPRWQFLQYTGLLAVVFGLPPVVRKAWQTIRLRHTVDANGMMVIAAFGAVLLGEYDEAASVSFLFAVSEFLEARAASKARLALSHLVELRPEHAAVVHPVTSQLAMVPAVHVPVGSTIAVRVGDKVAADGIVMEGTSAADESSLTGESVPVRKTVGDTVAGGSINVGTTRLLVRTTSTTADSAVSRLVRLVEEAQAHRSATEAMIDGFARAYTPIVVSMAALMCTLPWLWGLDTGRQWTLNGLIIVVIACPCALTISTPVTYAAGLAATAQRGIVIKGGASLEALGSVQKVIFDKTGTLTEGRFAVHHLQVVGDTHSRMQMLQLLAVMEAPSSHPLSVTLVKEAKKEGVLLTNDVVVRDHSILAGEGITANVDGVRVYVGNQRLFERVHMVSRVPSSVQQQALDFSNDGSLVGFIGTEKDGIIGMYCMADRVRDEAGDVIANLQSLGLELAMLTGDAEGPAMSVAKQIGMPAEMVHSGLLPEDKLQHVASIKECRERKHSYGLIRRHRQVLFCGDGVNDAPALTLADVGVSIGEGAAVAMDVSDVTLMDSNLHKLTYCIGMGRRVVATIRENIILSLACKVLVVAMTFAGHMTLLGAIASDVGVMLLVTVNGLKLLPSGNESDEKTGPALPVNLFGLKSPFMYEQVSSSLAESDGAASPTCVTELDGIV